MRLCVGQGRTVLRKKCRIALLPEPITEARRCETFPKAGREKRQVLAWRGLNDSGEGRVQRDCQHSARLLLANVDDAIANMLATHAYDIRASLRCVEQQCERQSGLAANCMMVLEGSNLTLGPSVETIRAILDTLNAGGRNIFAPALFDSERHQRLDKAQPMVCCCWR